MNTVIKKYMAEIGARGGRASKRRLSARDARAMVKIREARKAYKKFYASCFWSYPPTFKVTSADVSWVGEQLMKHGGAEAWRVGASLCP